MARTLPRARRCAPQQPAVGARGGIRSEEEGRWRGTAGCFGAKVQSGPHDSSKQEVACLRSGLSRHRSQAVEPRPQGHLADRSERREYRTDRQRIHFRGGSRTHRGSRIRTGSKSLPCNRTGASSRRSRTVPAGSRANSDSPQWLLFLSCAWKVYARRVNRSILPGNSPVTRAIPAFNHKQPAAQPFLKYRLKIAVAARRRLPSFPGSPSRRQRHR